MAPCSRSLPKSSRIVHRTPLRFEARKVSLSAPMAGGVKRHPQCSPTISVAPPGARSAGPTPPGPSPLTRKLIADTKPAARSGGMPTLSRAVLQSAFVRAPDFQSLRYEDPIYVSASSVAFLSWPRVSGFTL